MSTFWDTTLGRALSSANHYFVQSSTFRCLIRLNATSLEHEIDRICSLD